MHAGQVKAYFEGVAGEWDSMWLAWYDERVIEELADRTRVRRSSGVLDVGMGTGFVTAGLAPRVAHGGRRWPGARDAEVVHHNLGELGITNVELREADIARLPLATDSVDAAVANVVLHRAESPAAVLGEMARVTKPGGWVAVTDAVEHPYEWMRTGHAD